MVNVQADKGSGIFASAYLHEGQGTLTTVLINTSDQAKTIQINGANVPDKFELYKTTADEDCVDKGLVSRDSVFLPAKSVTTLVGQINTSMTSRVLTPSDL